METPTPLVLTVDARGWSVTPARKLQKIFEKAAIKPIWLVTWVELQNADLVAFLAEGVEAQTVEVGVLLDVPSTPGGGVEERIAFMAEAVERLTGVRPLAHRAADWSVDEPMFAALSKVGFKVDVTVTPHVFWRANVDYTTYSEKSYLTPQGILEVPVTVRTIKRHDFLLDLRKVPGLPGHLARQFFPTEEWLEPGGATGPLVRLAHRCRSEGSAFLQMTVTERGLQSGTDALLRQVAVFFAKTEGWWQGVSSTDLFRAFQHSVLKNGV